MNAGSTLELQNADIKADSFINKAKNVTYSTVKETHISKQSRDVKTIGVFSVSARSSTLETKKEVSKGTKIFIRAGAKKAEKASGSKAPSKGKAPASTDTLVADTLKGTQSFFATKGNFDLLKKANKAITDSGVGLSVVSDENITMTNVDIDSKKKIAFEAKNGAVNILDEADTEMVF